MGIPPPDPQPTGSQRMRYGEAAYRLRVIVDTLSWATGLRPSYVILALVLAFILAFGSAVTGAVLLLTSGRTPSLKPGDGAFGPVNGDEAAAEAERAAAAAASAESAKTKRKDSTQFVGAGGLGGRGSTASGGYSAGMGPGGPVGGGAGGPYGGRTIPVYNGDRTAEEQGYAGQERTPAASKGRRTAKAGAAGGSGQKPELQRSQLTGWGADAGGQSQAFIDGRPGQGTGPGGAEAGGAGGGGEGPAGGGGGTSKGALGQGLTPLPKVPEIGAGTAVRGANAKGSMPTSSHNVAKGTGADEDKDKDKKKGEKAGEFKASEAGPPGGQGGKAWEIYLDKSRAHDLPDGKGVHEPPQEPQTIGVK